MRVPVDRVRVAVAWLLAIQDLVPTFSIGEIFVTVHSENIALFEVGKPVSDEISSFLLDGSSNAFKSFSSGQILRGFLPLLTM